MQFAQDTEFTRIDLWGRRKRVKTKGAAADLAVSTAPAFLRSPVAIRAVSAGESRFPADRVPDGLHEVCRMDRPEQWTLTGQPDPRLECPRRDYPPVMTQGKMELSLADDAQRGKCLELKLVPERPLPDIVGEYALLRLKQPIPVERVPRTVGLWVRGNSSWGRVMWELVDAKGTHWLSCGRGGWGCDMLDWEGRVSINFDGWNFLQMSLPRHPEQGPEGWMFPQWLNSGGDLHLNPPLRLSGVAVLLYRKAPCLDQLEPVENLSVRLQGLSVLPE